ncbi:LexA family transcriptional regulator [Arachnia propionica]|uniref:LexA family protein n=1 Tax=Arachnia propionica TaxID=1750 RepID=UPI0021AB4F86|nr:translesion error-prone DNA polymerase V autoproteolytic subunit [Arachnia propionica]
MPRPVDVTTRAMLLAAPVAVPCGFPSPAQDYYEGPIDLTAQLVDDELTTFIVRVSGDSMTDAGICDGDELLVDTSKEPRAGDVVVARLDGEFTVKRLDITRDGVILRAEGRGYPDIVVPELAELDVFGVATYCIHHLRNQRR